MIHDCELKLHVYVDSAKARSGSRILEPSVRFKSLQVKVKTQVREWFVPVALAQRYR